MVKYSNSSLKQDGFWIYTESVPPNTEPNIFNPELIGEINEIECRIVFDTDASYYLNDTLYISLANPNQNAKIIFGDIFINESNDIQPKSRNAVPIWEKSSVMIKASFADIDVDNFLGHTRRVIYTPIKYYKILSNDQKFWLEFYSSVDYRCPVDFPCRKIIIEVEDDNGDKSQIEYEEPILNLLLEWVLLFDFLSII
jgi:hypothetical protein